MSASTARGDVPSWKLPHPERFAPPTDGQMIKTKQPVISTVSRKKRSDANNRRDGNLSGLD